MVLLGRPSYVRSLLLYHKHESNRHEPPHFSPPHLQVTVPLPLRRWRPCCFPKLILHPEHICFLALPPDVAPRTLLLCPLLSPGLVSPKFLSTTPNTQVHLFLYGPFLNHSPFHGFHTPILLAFTSKLFFQPISFYKFLSHFSGQCILLLTPPLSWHYAHCSTHSFSTRQVQWLSQLLIPPASFEIDDKTEHSLLGVLSALASGTMISGSSLSLTDVPQGPTPSLLLVSLPLVSSSGPSDENQTSRYLS